MVSHVLTDWFRSCWSLLQHHRSITFGFNSILKVLLNFQQSLFFSHISLSLLSTSSFSVSVSWLISTFFNISSTFIDGVIFDFLIPMIHVFLIVNLSVKSFLTFAHTICNSCTAACPFKFILVLISSPTSCIRAASTT